MKRFDPLVKKANQRLSGTRLSIANLISSTPGLSETELAQWLNLSKQTVHYHVREMESTGMVKVNREGGSARCFPGQKMTGDDEGPDVMDKATVPNEEEFKPT